MVIVKELEKHKINDKTKEMEETLGKEQAEMFLKMFLLSWNGPHNCKSVVMNSYTGYRLCTSNETIS